MRAQFTVDLRGRVHIAFDRPWKGDRVVRTYTCIDGLVYNVTRHRKPVPCRVGMARTGEHLRCDGDLLETLRREYQKFKRNQVRYKINR